MDTKKYRLKGDCSHFTFSRKNAERIRGDAIASGIRQTTWFPWSRGASMSLDKSAALLMLNEQQEESVFRLATLNGRPKLEWPIKIPDRDPRGILSAERFECWKSASDSRTGSAGYFYSFKARGEVALHSHLEARLLAKFEMNPFVLEIRTQYPSWDREDFLEYCDKGKLLPRNELMTIDFMLLVQVPGIPYPVYHGVSGKPEKLLAEKLVLGRHEREAGRLSQWGCTHEVMTDKAVTDVEYESCRRMFEHMKFFELNEIEQYVEAASNFADALIKTKAEGSADRVVSMVGNRYGWDRDESFRLLALAIFLGYLKWDFRYPYFPHDSLALLR